MVSCGLHSFSGNICIQVDIARFRELSQLLSNSVLRQSLLLNRELMYLLGRLVGRQSSTDKISRDESELSELSFKTKHLALTDIQMT